MRATSPSSKSLPAAVAGIAAACVMAALPGLAAATPAPLALPDMVIKAGGAPDGSVHLVLSPSEGVYETTSVSPTGVLSDPIPVTLPGRKPTTVAGLGPDGSAVFATWHATGPGKGKLAAVSVSPTGVSSPATPLPGFDPTSLADSVTVGPTGAVAIVSTQTTRMGEIPTLAFKPAGQAAYGTALSLGPKLSAKQANIHTVTADVVLGPDGGGAVLLEQVGRAQTAQPVIRRITPDGQLGPAIPVPVGKHFITVPTLAVAPSGAIAILFDLDDGKPGKPEQNQIALATLDPGAAAIGAVQQLGISSSHALGGDDVAIAIGPGDQTAVVAGPGKGGIRVFSGPLGALVARPNITATRPIAASVVVGPDGSATALWTSIDPGMGPDTIVSAHAPVGGAFAAPVAQTSYKSGITSLLVVGGPIALPNGTIAAAYLRDSGYTNGLIRFTP